MAYSSSDNNFAKDEGEKFDYKIDWRDDVLEDGENISNSEWTVPNGLTAASNTNTNDETVIWLEGGDLDDEVYEVVNVITTTMGRKYERSIYIHMVNK